MLQFINYKQNIEGVWLKWPFGEIFRNYGVKDKQTSILECIIDSKIPF